MTGILTGKDFLWGSLIRPATGYGNVYFAQSMLETNSSFCKTIVVSGSGNVAQYSTEKATQLGGKVVTMSDSAGYIYDAEGIDAVFVMELKMN
jgi:glutamate dehydrogenase (NADP+)